MVWSENLPKQNQFSFAVLPPLSIHSSLAAEFAIFVKRWSVKSSSRCRGVSHEGRASLRVPLPNIERPLREHYWQAILQIKHLSETTLFCWNSLPAIFAYHRRVKINVIGLNIIF